MLKNDYIFPALFTYDADGITVEFPDLSGAITAGDSEEEALLMAKECLKLHLYGMEEDKEEIPNASHIINIEHNKNQAIVLIKANMRATRDEMNNKAVKKTLTIPKWLNDEAMNKKIRMCRGVKEENREMAKFGFMITNLSKDLYPKEQIYPIYSLRWQIELEFKNWKSILEIDESGRKLKKERIEAHFYGKLINILVNNDVSKILKDEIEIGNVILSDKKVFNQVSYYLEKLHHYNYRLGDILYKLKKLIQKTCLKSKRKGSISSDEILKLVT